MENENKYLDLEDNLKDHFIDIKKEEQINNLIKNKRIEELKSFNSFNFTDKLSAKEGIYTILTVDNITGKVISMTRGHNLITYQGSSILAKCLSGDTKFKIAYMYGEHAPNGTYGDESGLEPQKSDTIEVLRTSPRSTENAEVPVIYANFTNQDGYDFNIVTFTASFTSSALTDRQFVGAGLVAIANGEEFLFNHAYYPTHLKAASHDIIIIWSIKFTS